MDTLFEIAVVGLWLVTTVVAWTRVLSSRARIAKLPPAADCGDGMH